MTAKEFVQTFRMMPSSTQGNMVQEIVQELNIEHRTNQASVIRTMQNILQAFAQSSPVTDLRNEAAVNFAEKVAEIENPIPYI
jgi:polyhydroxyalkanoate synthesis regulator phasin